MFHASNAVLQLVAAESVPALPIQGAVTTLSEALPLLIRFLQSPVLRTHPVWKNLLPFGISEYGRGKRSLGHSIGIDLIIDKSGAVKATEFDFAPSGRGYLLRCLPEEIHGGVLGTFADWYQSMRLPEQPDQPLSYYYATASKTICFPETQYFCERLREHGIEIDAANIDELSRKGEKLDRVVDRLFYASELAVQKMAPARMMTKEPYLDSKMVYAMLCDSDLTPLLESVFGEELLVRFRALIPMSYALDRLRQSCPETLESIVSGTNRHAWVVKNTDVETDDSWGCRGVVLGVTHGEREFREAVTKNVSPDKKGIGQHPILQRYHESRDFTDIWNGIVSGKFFHPPIESFGKAEYLPMTRELATREVSARIRPYVLIDASRADDPRVFVPPYAVMTLRQDPLAHGSRDALFAACRIR